MAKERKHETMNSQEDAAPCGPLKRLVGWFCCIIGYHNWKWNLEDCGGTLYLDKPPPDCAVCTRCGVKFGK